MKDLTIKDVVVKISSCNKCQGIIRVAVKHLMDRKSKNDFAKEAMENNLNIKEQPLIDYREQNSDWCECEIK